MTKVFTLSLRCSPKMLIEQLSQQQLYIRLIAKLLKLFRSLSTLSNLLNMLTPMSTLSKLVETRMDKGLDKDAHVSNLGEQLDQTNFMGPSGEVNLCGTEDREKALVSEVPRGGHIGVAGGHFWSGQWLIQGGLSGQLVVTGGTLQ